MVVAKKTRPKKPRRKRVVETLDWIYSQYIRMEKSDWEWFCVCVTCSKKMRRQEIQNWHFISRWFYRYRREDINCRPQCMRCNVFKNWSYVEYTIFMQNIIFKWEKDLFDYFWNSKNEIYKVSTPDLEATLMNIYPKRVELRKHKGYWSKKMPNAMMRVIQECKWKSKKV